MQNGQPVTFSVSHKEVDSFFPNLDRRVNILSFVSDERTLIDVFLIADRKIVMDYGGLINDGIELAEYYPSYVVFGADLPYQEYSQIEISQKEENGLYFLSMKVNGEEHIAVNRIHNLMHRQDLKSDKFFH